MKEGSVWNENSRSWRQLWDSSAIKWIFTTKDQASLDLVDGGITLAKLENRSANRVIGRDNTSGAGPPQSLTVGTGLDTNTAATLKLSDTAVTPGTYNGLVVDQQGRITSASAVVTQDGALLTSGTVTNAATADFVLTSYTSYRSIIIYLYDIIPQTDDTQLFARVSTNGGSSYDASATDYAYANLVNNSGETTPTDGSTGAAQIGISTNDANFKLSTDAGATGAFLVELHNRNDATAFPMIKYDGGNYGTTGQAVVISGVGYRKTAQDTDAIRFLMSSGNINLKYAIYGRN